MLQITKSGWGNHSLLGSSRVHSCRHPWNCRWHFYPYSSYSFEIVNRSCLKCSIIRSETKILSATRRCRISKLIPFLWQTQLWGDLLLVWVWPPTVTRWPNPILNWRRISFESSHVMKYTTHISVGFKVIFSLCTGGFVPRVCRRIWSGLGGWLSCQGVQVWSTMLSTHTVWVLKAILKAIWR